MKTVDEITVEQWKQWKQRRKGTDWEGAFERLWHDIAPDNMPKRQHRFAPSRKWAFDFCWPERMVAVEIEGCTWQKGRHTSGKGYQADCEKYNAATLLGWRVLRYTGTDLKQRSADMLAEITKLLNAKG